VKTQTFLLLLIIGMAGPVIRAQSPLSISSSTLEGHISMSGHYLMPIGDNYSLEGSPYMHQDFIEGALRIKGAWYENARLRFNAYKGEFEVELDEKIYAITPEMLLTDSIRYDKETFVIKDINPGNQVLLNYLALVHEDSTFSLCKKYSVRFVDAEKAKGYSDEKPAQFKESPVEYYLFTYNRSWKIRRASDIAEIFDLENKVVKKYLAKNKYKLNNDPDLTAVITHFSSLERSP
jgi:hypothetical protein